MKTKIIPIIVISLVVIAGFIGGYLAMKSETAIGSVVIGNDYQATTTVGMGSSTMKVIGLRNPDAVGAQSSTSLSALGNVVIAKPSSGTFTLWDATSTIDAASTTIATFAAPSIGLTHPIDIILKRGLIIQLPAGYDGETLITYR